MLKPRRKPTVKEAMRKLAEAENKLILARLEQEQTKRSMDITFALFNAVLDNAATIGEARRWWADWTTKISAIDPDAPDAHEQYAQAWEDFKIEVAHD